MRGACDHHNINHRTWHVNININIEVSLDYLAFDDREDFSGVDIADLKLLHKLQALDKLSDDDKATVKAVLDTFILNSKFQELVG